MAYLVQDCGCIALPEDVQRETGLGPGASFEIAVAEDGRSVTLICTRPSNTEEFSSRTACSISATRDQ